MLTSLHDRLLAKYARLIGALGDPRRRTRAILWLAAGYALAWWLYAVIAKSSQGINADMAEMVVWGRNFDWGYPKHPPLLGWVLGIWFVLFPNADWAFHLLPALTLASGIALSYLLAGEWLEGDKRAIAPFLLAMIPFYNFLGLKFDQNSALIPLWALTTWAFVRSLDTRSAVFAALAGAGAAAAMLTKYWSAFFVLALIVAALFDRRRGAYFRSAAPWITIGVGALLIAPHVVWLFKNNFPPLNWVGTRRTSQGITDALGSLAEYSFGTLGYCAFALIVFGLYVRPSLAGLRDSAFSNQLDRRRAAIIFWTPLLAPIALAFALRTNLLSLWNTPALALLPVMLMASPRVKVTRDAAARIAATAVTFTVVVVLISPVIAGIMLRLGVENHAAFARGVADKIDGEWKATSDKPLTLVAGPFGLVSTASFYLRDKPSTFADFSPYLAPWMKSDTLARNGGAIVCPVSDSYCGRNLDIMAARQRGGRRTEVEIVPQWLWMRGTPERFLIATLPPQ